jgi:hypothetical protein
MKGLYIFETMDASGFTKKERRDSHIVEIGMEAVGRISAGEEMSACS